MVVFIYLRSRDIFSVFSYRSQSAAGSEPTKSRPSKDDSSQEYIVLLIDQYLMELPLEALECFQSYSIASLTREISLQMLYHKFHIEPMGMCEYFEVTETVFRSVKNQKTAASVLLVGFDLFQGQRKMRITRSFRKHEWLFPVWWFLWCSLSYFLLPPPTQISNIEWWSWYFGRMVNARVFYVIRWSLLYTSQF